MMKEIINTDPRSRRTRELLKQAMCKLMQQKNISSISVTDITETATVNRATFYSHFSDKQELLETCVRDWFRDHLESSSSRPVAFDRQGLSALIGAIADFITIWNKPGCRMAHREIHPLVESTIQAEMYDYIQHWFPAVYPQISADPGALDPIATLLSWALFGAAKRVSSEESLAAQLTDKLVLLLSDGIFATLARYQMAESVA